MSGSREAQGDKHDLVVVGFLIPHADGYQVRIGPDRTRAELYAARNHATLEPMYVRRCAPTA